MIDLTSVYDSQQSKAPPSAFLRWWSTHLSNLVGTLTDNDLTVGWVVERGLRRYAHARTDR